MNNKSQPQKLSRSLEKSYFPSWNNCKVFSWRRLLHFKFWITFESMTNWDQARGFVRFVGIGRIIDNILKGWKYLFQIVGHKFYVNVGITYRQQPASFFKLTIWQLDNCCWLKEIKAVWFIYHFSTNKCQIFYCTLISKK